MQVETSREDDIWMVVIKGHLAVEPGADLDAKLDTIRNTKESRVLVDVSEVDSIDSTGVGLLLNICTAIARIPNGRFVLVGANSRVRHVLHATRLNEVISLADDLSSGQEILRAH